MASMINRVYLRVYLIAALALLIVAPACAQGSSTQAAPSPSETSTPTQTPTQKPAATEPLPPVEIKAFPNWRFVNSGWVQPKDDQSAGAFSQVLKAFVITDQQEFDEFNGGFTLLRSRATASSLARVEFQGSILLAAYYVWRPLQGDPLSIVGFSVEGNQATVEMELEEQPQGRLRPYLMAPMTVVAVERSLFSTPGPVEFVFQVNGKTAATVTAVIK